MSKDYYRRQIASKRKSIIDLREDKKKLADRKRSRIESLSRSIKSSSSSSSKASYRKQKIDVRERYKRDAERIKDRIDRLRNDISSLRERMRRA